MRKRFLDKYSAVGKWREIDDEGFRYRVIKELTVQDNPSTGIAEAQTSSVRSLMEQNKKAAIRRKISGL